VVRILYVVQILVFLALANAAWAQDERGIYAGASIGQANYKHSCTGATGVRCDNNDDAVRLFFGYQFTPRFAMEIGLHKLGTLVATGDGAFGITDRADVSAIDFVYAGSWRLGNRYSLLTKLGFYFGEVESQISAAPPSPRRGWATTTTTSITYGLGVSYALTQHADFRLEWQHFGHLGTGSTPELDIHLISFGALYRF